MLDYETLRIIWWLLLGVLLIGFAIMDGFDMGVGMLLPVVAKEDHERRILINTVGPVWEGNQVWFILGGGAIFAAWPPLYAVSFSGFYLAMFAILAALILRPVGFKYRSKMANPKWRENWDKALFIGGFVPALLAGTAVGNVLMGVPFSFDDIMRPSYDGGLFGLLRPFALIAGLVSVSMLVMHGANYIAMKTEKELASRARFFGQKAALGCLGLFAFGGLVLALFIHGYQITSEIDPNGASNPLAKTVETGWGLWLVNYIKYPWMLLAPIMGLGGAYLSYLYSKQEKDGLAFLGSATSIFGIISTAGLSMFPFLLPSNLDPNHSLTVWDASSSKMTLEIMLICTIIFLPIVLTYTAWVYKVLWGKVTREDVEANSQSY